MLKSMEKKIYAEGLEKEFSNNLERDVYNFASMFHWGVLGIEKTYEDLRRGVEKVIESGFKIQAFNTEMTLAKVAKQMLGGKQRIHIPISYPLGNMTIKKKLIDLEYAARIGSDESCIVLNHSYIFSKKYREIEKEVQLLNDEFGNIMDLAFVLNSSILSDNEIIDSCMAIGNGGGVRIKLSCGYGWGVSPEEVRLVKCIFGSQFDVHPSGNIRTLEQVEEYLKLGVTVLHSLSAFDIIDQYINKRISEKANE